ncbi:unnamed protein product [Tuwongella immobilis]|uniref:Uncharacterized protein n=1 Tax=Tuwongella immobilis TaxID=692036 RepID=A0A6C2YSJ2_9BACT|nr:unnamed protein product [Tuwongella immobilis]VTS06214.1 unnamed protein product [Tuwongella immobilis]
MAPFVSAGMTFFLLLWPTTCILAHRMGRNWAVWVFAGPIGMCLLFYIQYRPTRFRRLSEETFDNIGWATSLISLFLLPIQMWIWAKFIFHVNKQV